ncbi:prepilin-type N-terminal cleavage/methylation domain-containing protein [Terrimicrobium sacchariphilum]|uniref:Prepilin-type N-terminal cleavage/methylation domain-containing protein n=1 Tax=Terrimicrobium sacchariphilum TaxID=690879 RepID=A0A146G423_TERSA|nr:prepilin-type N-terminal cleavage/methylation domain-containing protein [Terrimicrobium sacchariphilum]GAT32192.1 prepilin-type N-terminal cleavage/methylation domain-containing protein [Terrimicrobium sacchariphilum]
MMFHNLIIPRLPSRHREAFSLVELLFVIAIIGLLATATVPALNSITDGGNASSSTLKLASFLEQARQYATAQNTYVYISFLPRDSGGPEASLWVTAVASNSGSDIAARGTKSFVVGSGDAEGRQLTHTLKLNGMVTEKKGQIPLSAVSRPDPAQSVEPIDTGASTFGPIGGATFPIGFWFSPDGSASTDSDVPTRIELAIRPDVRPDPKWASVIQIAGLTGSVHVYRSE